MRATGRTDQNQVELLGYVEKMVASSMFDDTEGTWGSDKKPRTIHTLADAFHISLR